MFVSCFYKKECVNCLAYRSNAENHQPAQHNLFICVCTLVKHVYVMIGNEVYCLSKFIRLMLCISLITNALY